MNIFLRFRVFLLWVHGIAIGFGIVRDRDRLGRSPRVRDAFRDALVSGQSRTTLHRLSFSRTQSHICSGFCFGNPKMGNAHK